MLSMRNNLADDFARLGLSEYLSRFTEEGFTDWSSIADITESDLAALGVKLGHRRTLYREIATLRGYPQSERLEDIPKPVPGSLPSSINEENRSPCDVSASGSDGQTSPASCVEAAPQKRRYKRHPKPDDNAPTRPPSAYVLFANVIREEQKDTNLSFTQLARLVGERWKNLATSEKEAIESQAAEVKRRYTAEVGVYKKSPEYHQYQAYLREFKQRVLKDERPEKLEPPRKAQRTMHQQSPAAHAIVVPNTRDHLNHLNTRNEHEHEPRGGRQGSGGPFTIPSILQEGSRRGDDRVLPSLDYVYKFGTQEQYNSLNEKPCLQTYAARPILPRPEFSGPMDNILPTAMYNSAPQWNEEVRLRSVPTERPQSTGEGRPQTMLRSQESHNSYVNR